ncbi:MAG: hypothetical protein Q9221_006310 [Calogaya cf. arnoldii]
MAGTATKHAVASTYGHSIDHSLNQHLDLAAHDREASTMPVATTGNVTTMDMAGEQAPFPFMKLPPELRVMVYNYHFFQPVEHLTPHSWTNFRPDDVPECIPGGPICHLGIVNNRVHLGNLWVTSKTIYNEAMPIYFSTHYFQFASIESLGHFLTTIPYYHRQHITKLRLNYNKRAETNNFDIQQAGRLLSECPNLSELAIGIWCNNLLLNDRNIVLKSLLQVRGIETLDIRFTANSQSCGCGRIYRSDSPPRSLRDWPF